MLIRTLAALLTLLLVQVAPSSAANSNAPVQVKKQLRLSGELAIVTLPDNEQWVVRSSDGKLTPVDRQAFGPVKKDKTDETIELFKTDDGADASVSDLSTDVISQDPTAEVTRQILKKTQEAEFEPGATVSLDCDLDDEDFCTPTLGTTAELLAAAAPTSPSQGAVATPATFQRLLVMILNYTACGMPPALTPTEVRTMFLGPNGDGAGGVAEKYTQCSYGQFNLNASAFRAEVITPTGCSTAVTASCSWWAISNGADTAAKAIPGLNFPDFTHYAYIVPPGLNSVCPWAGLALLPGKQIWLQTSSYGVFRWATIMQESLHNYGLWHSWKDGIEYDDYGTAMGRGDACPNAPEISRMGWATPAASGGAISSTVLSLTGVPATYTLPAAYLTGSGSYLRLLTDWLPAYSVSSTARNLYISVRVGRGPDGSLGLDYAPRIHVHEVNATMDNGLPTMYVNGDRRISIIGRIAPLTRVDVSAYKLVVYGGSWVGSTDNLRVHLCRYAASAAECPPLSVLEPIGLTPPPSPPRSLPPPSPKPSPPRPLPPSPVATPSPAPPGGAKKSPPPSPSRNAKPPPPAKDVKKPPPPQPQVPSAPSSGGKCDKCNIPLCAGGCKCDNNCNCRWGLGGAPCDKCNMAQSEGGCKCDNMCNCRPGSCWYS